MKPSLIIEEIYLSIQGEAAYAGRPCVFVRLSGCPLRCRWCDTSYAFDNGTEMQLDEIMEKITGYQVNTVELTGGEPLAQPNAIPLMQSLINKGFTVLLETGGSIDVAPVPKETHIIMDIKCPDSRMSDKNKLSNLDHLKPTDDIKFVIASYEDFIWAKQLVDEHRLDNRFNVLFSPAFGLVKPKDLAAWILEHRLDIKLQLQIHKYIWDPKAKGV